MSQFEAHCQGPAAEVAARLGLSVDSVYQAKKRVADQVSEIVGRIREQEG